MMTVSLLLMSGTQLRRTGPASTHSVEDFSTNTNTNITNTTNITHTTTTTTITTTTTTINTASSCSRSSL